MTEQDQSVAETTAAAAAQADRIAGLEATVDVLRQRVAAAEAAAAAANLRYAELYRVASQVANAVLSVAHPPVG